MMPGPGSGWALVRSAQEAMRRGPEAYWRETVLPVRRGRGSVGRAVRDERGEDERCR